MHQWIALPAGDAEKAENPQCTFDFAPLPLLCILCALLFGDLTENANRSDR
jgi:hypothetical protein